MKETVLMLLIWLAILTPLPLVSASTLNWVSSLPSSPSSLSSLLLLQSLASMSFSQSSASLVSLPSTSSRSELQLLQLSSTWSATSFPPSSQLSASSLSSSRSPASLPASSPARASSRSSSLVDQTLFQWKSDSFIRQWRFQSHPWNHCVFKEDGDGIVSSLCGGWSQLKPAQHAWDQHNISNSISHLVLSCDVTTITANQSTITEDRRYCACASFPLDDPGGNTTILETDEQRDATVASPWPCHMDSIQSWIGTNISGIAALYLGHAKLQDLSGFEGLVSMEYLQIEYSNISTMPQDLLCTLHKLQVLILNDAFAEYDSGSEFRWDMLGCGPVAPPSESLVAVVITQTELLEVPPDAFQATPRLELLELTNDGIHTLFANSFSGLSKLKELNLGYNNISGLPTGLFAMLSQLQYVVLEHNDLSYINVDDMAHLQQLRELSLANNAIVALDGSFCQLKNLNTLDLQFNHIRTIPTRLFQNSTYLVKLNVSHNSIENIADDAFLDMTFLGSLALYGNRLWDSANLARALRGRKLERLQILKLAHNNLTELPERMFYSVPYLWFKLVLLDLNNNQIEHIHNNAFEGLTTLRMLSLQNNRISQLMPGTFNQLDSLVYLYLNFNFLDKFPGDLFSNRSQIGWIALEGNNQSHIPKFDHVMSQLKILDLSYNSVSSVLRHDLQHVPNLQVFILDWCNLSYVEPGSFQNTPGIQQIVLSHNQLELNFSIDTFGRLSNLGVLNLSYNNIRSVDDLLKHKLKFVPTIDLSGNPIRELPEHPAKSANGLLNDASIESLFLSNCQISRVSPRAFALFKFITYIDLSGNRLLEFSPFQIQTITHNYIVIIVDNPLKCSCRMSWLKMPDYSSHYRASTCTHAVTSATEDIWTLPRSQFLCRNVDSCLVQSRSAQCYTQSEGGPTTYVDLSHSQLTDIPRGIPATTQILHLEGNHFRVLSLQALQDKTQVTELHLEKCGIEEIQTNTFVKLPYLKTLHLEHNKLTNLTELGLSPVLRALYVHNNSIHIIHTGLIGGLVTLQELTLHGNDLHHLEEEFMDDISSLVYLETLTLYDNPWECPCDNGTFKEWLLHHSESIQRLSDMICNTTQIINIPDDEFLCYDVDFQVMVTNDSHLAAFVGSLTSALLLATVLSVLILCYYHRTLLAVIIYAKFGWRFSAKECEDWPYAAITAYDEHNSEVLLWIRDVLVPNLEPQLQLCIPDRDFEPATVESEEVVKRVNMSKRSLFLLSRGSLNDEKLIYMFHKAYSRWREDPRHRIIVIVWEDFDIQEALENPEYEENMKAFLKTKEYVVLNDKRFWHNLLYRMPVPLSIETESETLGTQQSTDHVYSHVPLRVIKM